ncbi:MAG: ATP-binding protein [Pseudomonadota bacterium]
MASSSVPKKFRPSVALILIVVNITILVLPLGSLIFFRIYEGRLIHETEAELISQGAVLSAAYRQALKRLMPDHKGYGAPLSGKPLQDVKERYLPIPPQIDLARDDLLEPRPDPVPTAARAAPQAILAGIELTQLFFSARRTTLSGMLLLDHQGIVVGGANWAGRSLAHVREVRSALAGSYTSVLRRRISDQPPPSYASISRGTGVRIFAAFPIVDGERLWGVVYLSRTPNNILKHLYASRNRAIALGLVILGLTLLLAWITSRTLLKPIHGLSEQARSLAEKRSNALEALPHYGTREVAALGQSFMDMAEALEKRSQYIRDFATHVSHEFKTPLTSIRGSAELVAEHHGEMSDDERARFLGNIEADAARLKALVDRLMELARSDNPLPLTETMELGAALERARSEYRAVTFENRTTAAVQTRLSDESLGIIMSNLIDNALAAGATSITVTLSGSTAEHQISVSDNGPGISEGNRAKIYDPFFTTKRDEGGTGLGLGIVRSLVEAHNGRIELVNTRSGASFRLSF